MAIRQVGNLPVYSIEVEVPKITDARGKSYGSFVSDLRWKIWEEVQNSQLQQMKFEQMSKQAQLDVLEQRQRDVSRAIRDANEMKAKIKAGESGGNTYAQWIQRERANQVTHSSREVPINDPYGIRARQGLPLTATVTSKTWKSKIGEPPPEVLEDGSDTEAAQKNFERQQNELDQYIADLEAQQTALGQEFQAFTSGLAQSPDLLTRTRNAYKNQIGEGGFGVPPRRLRQQSSFDTGAVQRVDDTIAREENALLQEALRRKSDRALNRIDEIMALGEGEQQGALIQSLRQEANNPTLTSDEQIQVRDLARKRLLEQFRQAGATPTTSAGFLMKDFPKGSALLPREETRFPTGRIRDDFGVSGTSSINRESEVLRDLPYEMTPEQRRLRQEDLDTYEEPPALPRTQFTDELQNISAIKNAPVNAPSSLPEAQRRAIELEALGVAAEEAQTRGAVPSERGFNYPVEKMGEGFGRTSTFGAPGGVLDRINVATRRLPDVTSPSAENLPMEPMTFGGGPLPATPEGPEIVPEFGPETEMPEDKVKVPGRAPLPDGTPIEEAKAKPTSESRRDLYSMRLIKKGIELADKPKQFARVAKTENPSAAPEYVKIVNGVYELNASRPDRFKASYDEVARVYKDNPKDREKALSYLIAKDAIESNVTRPLA